VGGSEGNQTPGRNLIRVPRRKSATPKTEPAARRVSFLNEQLSHKPQHIVAQLSKTPIYRAFDKFNLAPTGGRCQDCNFQLADNCSKFEQRY